MRWYHADDHGLYDLIRDRVRQFISFGGSADPTYAVDYLPAFLSFGLDFALGFASVMVQAIEGIADHEQGLASGLVQTSGQIGGRPDAAAPFGFFGHIVLWATFRSEPGARQGFRNEARIRRVPGPPTGLGTWRFRC
ncbi:hypothetical protein [Nocardia sp. NPDC049707]|uniref:hypothetical protein n=1 Tax=Nocardia sp. NPDC049707 TaxID=3154735 RepID=UPI00341F17D2